jgi:energy-coupling factor transport system permease protein
LKEVTIGQYYPSNSIIHKLDPRVKLLGTLIFIISLFVANSYINYLFITVVLFTLLKLTKVPLKMLFKGLRAIIIILMVSVVFTMFLTPGTTLVKIGAVVITKQGLKKAAYLAIRLVYLVISTSVMTLTTTPNDLSDGLEKSFGILSKIHVPVHEISMMMSIALRFIPILMEETDKITMAQKARGADFESGNVLKKVKSMIPILVPLFISSIRRALDLANAMEARCYNGGKGRTKMKPLKHKSRDYKAYGIILAYMCIVISLNIVVNSLSVLQIFVVG